MSATVIEFKPRLPERVCRACSPAHALKCQRCARWSCLHYTSTGSVLGRVFTLCRWCADLTPSERAEVEQ